MGLASSAAPIILDVEASGFGVGSYPIEIGIVLPDQSTHCRLVKPCDDWRHWDKDAERLHKVKRDQLFETGSDVAAIVDWLNDMLGSAVVYTDAWLQDMCWLGKLYDKAGCIPLFQLKPIVSLLNEKQMDVWSSTKSQLHEACEAPRHRASNDALVIQHTLMKLLGNGGV